MFSLLCYYYHYFVLVINNYILLFLTFISNEQHKVEFYHVWRKGLYLSTTFNQHNFCYQKEKEASRTNSFFSGLKIFCFLLFFFCPKNKTVLFSTWDYELIYDKNQQNMNILFYWHFCDKGATAMKTEKNDSKNTIQKS